MTDRKYTLKCLICGHTENNLVALQEHAMDFHGYTQADHRRVSRRIVEHGYIWTMPDGVDWMEARHIDIRAGRMNP